MYIYWWSVSILPVTKVIIFKWPSVGLLMMTIHICLNCIRFSPSLRPIWHFPLGKATNWKLIVIMNFDCHDDDARLWIANIILFRFRKVYRCVSVFLQNHDFPPSWAPQARSEAWEVYQLKLFRPDDPSRPCRPKAGQGLVMIMMIMTVVVMMIEIVSLVWLIIVQFRSGRWSVKNGHNHHQ